VIGLGAQDDLDYAQDFLADRGPFSFPMYWDGSFESWNQLGLTSQPAAALFAADGTELGAWLGRIPEDKVLELIASS
jgi:hypothetical protein